MTPKITDYKPRELREIERLQRAYGVPFNEAAELYEFDTNHTDSDKATKEYLMEVHGIDASTIDTLFYKTPAEPRENRAKIRKATEKAQERRENRLEYLARTLGSLEIFGACQTISNTGITFKAPETGFGITVKLTRHKVQKVVTRSWSVEDDAEDISTQRILALHKAIKDAPHLFEAPSFAKSQVGIAERDERYPFASIKITHHKS